MSIKVSEAQIQAEFYHHCRLKSIPVLLELSTPVGRLDAVVMDESFSIVLAIIECKRQFYNPNSRQFQRYRSIGVPVFPLLAMDDAEPLAAKIKSLPLTGVKLAVIMRMSKAKRRSWRRSKNVLRDLDEDVNYKP